MDKPIHRLVGIALAVVTIHIVPGILYVPADVLPDDIHEFPAHSLVEGGQKFGIIKDAAVLVAYRLEGDPETDIGQAVAHHRGKSTFKQEWFGDVIFRLKELLDGAECRHGVSEPTGPWCRQDAIEFKAVDRGSVQHERIVGTAEQYGIARAGDINFGTKQGVPHFIIAPDFMEE